MFARVVISISFAGLLLLTGCGADPDQRLYYAIEENGVAIGWCQVDVHKPDPGQSGPWRVESEVVVRTRILEQSVDHWQSEKALVDADSGQMIQMESRTRTGQVEIRAGYTANDSTVIISLPGGISADPICRTSNLRLDSSLLYTYLLSDLPPGQETPLEDEVLDLGGAGILTRQVTWVSGETLTLAGVTYESQVYQLSYPGVGVTMKIWVDQSSGLLLRRLSPSGGAMVLTDAGIKSRTTRGELDNQIICATNDSIARPEDITTMQLRVVLYTIGERTTVEGLNTPGQRFEGTVENNRVDGMFFLTPVRYNGDGAPDFPSDQPQDSRMKRFLSPEMFIESDDSDIINKAHDLTAGATDRWDAAVRLSRWVGDEIGYAIPGGGTAKRTLEVGEGECGSHTRLLTAMCRAVGIPARFVMGGMYFNGRTAGFGQHAWTEIHMGPDVGWVSVDATIREYDYINGGHIRLGEKATFHPSSIEILDYTLLEN